MGNAESKPNGTTTVQTKKSENETISKVTKEKSSLCPVIKDKTQEASSLGWSCPMGYKSTKKENTETTIISEPISTTSACPMKANNKGYKNPKQYNVIFNIYLSIFFFL